jgi:hypothetical protein
MDEAAVRITASGIEEINEALAGIGHSGAMLKYRTRNLEIPGLVLAHHLGMTAA